MQSSIPQLHDFLLQVDCLLQHANPEILIQKTDSYLEKLRKTLHDTIQQNYAALQKIHSFWNIQNLESLTEDQVLEVRTESAAKVEMISSFTKTIRQEQEPDFRPAYNIEKALRSLNFNKIQHDWFEQSYELEKEAVERGFKHFKAAGLELLNHEYHKIYQEVKRGWLELNSPGCLGEYACCISGGIGIAQDKAKAAQLYKKAARRGNLTALVNLAWLYNEGKGVKLDKEIAQFYLKLAAERGSVYALKLLGNMAFDKNDLNDALVFYRMAQLGADGDFLEERVQRIEQQQAQLGGFNETMTDLD